MPLPEEFIVYGSEEMLKPLIMQLLAQYYDQGSEQVSSGGTGRPPISPDFADWLMVTVVWKGVTQATLKNHTVEKSIRLVGQDPKTFSLVSLQALAQRVLSKFNNLGFTTGHVKVKYANYKDGLNTWGYFDTAENGYRIIEAIADIGYKSVKRERVRYEYVLNPAEAFPPIPERTTLSYKSVRTKSPAPIANMTFAAAYITYPYIGHAEQLCNRGGYIIRDLSFLNAYED